MKKAADYIYKLGENIIKYLFLIVTGGLSVGAVFLTEMSDNMIDQNMVLSIDKMYFTVPLTLILAMAGIGLCVLVRKNAQRLLTIMFAAVCVWYFVLGAILILRARSIPGADALTVYYMADAVSQGNLGVIDPVNSYMSYYPQQIGLTTFLAFFLRILHHFTLPIAEYHFIKVVYLVMICVATFAQYRVVRRLWNSDAACCIFLFISAVNLPYILYATYLYSEIPSYCFFSVGAWLLMELIDCKKGVKALVLSALSILAFTAAVFIRKNTLVLIIAVIIVTFFQLLKTKRLEWLAYSAICAVCCVMILPVVIAGYERAAGAELTSGVTAKSYFAMGMQEGGRGPGWYNGFNYDTYVESGLNPEIANEISSEAIEERMTYFKSNPGAALSFYARKFSTQWFDGTYASLQATYATVSDRSTFFNELYEGKYTGWFVVYCNALQNLVYIGAFLAILSLIRRGEQAVFWKYLFAIAVFGGLLFHMLWEANSRYIVTYSFLLIPYAALGLSEVEAKLGKKK